jgi:hypothetical protein
LGLQARLTADDTIHDTTDLNSDGRFFDAEDRQDSSAGQIGEAMTVVPPVRPWKRAPRVG